MAISLDTSQSSYSACQTPSQTGGTQPSPPADAVAPTDDQKRSASPVGITTITTAAGPARPRAFRCPTARS